MLECSVHMQYLKVKRTSAKPRARVGRDGGSHYHYTHGWLLRYYCAGTHLYIRSVLVRLVAEEQVGYVRTA